MQHGQIEKSVAQSSGAATPEEADARHRRASAFSGCSFGGDFAGSTKPHCGRGREAPCFGVWAAVCDLSPKAERVLTFAREIERGPFVREAENAMKCGLEQRRAGNFLAIVAEVSIGEKSNFTGRFFEWRRPFDFSTDRL